MSEERPWVVIKTGGTVKLDGKEVTTTVGSEYPWRRRFFVRISAPGYPFYSNERPRCPPEKLPLKALWHWKSRFEMRLLDVYRLLAPPRNVPMEVAHIYELIGDESGREYVYELYGEGRRAVCYLASHYLEVAPDHAVHELGGRERVWGAPSEQHYALCYALLEFLEHILRVSYYRLIY